MEQSSPKGNKGSFQRTIKHWQNKMRQNKKFLFISLLLIISIIAIAFSAFNLFNPSLEDWTTTRGEFEIADDNMKALHYTDNWIHHQSNVSYGVWEWEIKYYGSFSAAVTFIGSNFLPENGTCQSGYQLDFNLDGGLNLYRIDGINQRTFLNGYSLFKPEAQTYYDVTVTRASNNTFGVFIDNAFAFRAVDGNYTTSEIFQVNFYRFQQLSWVRVQDLSASDLSWFDYFSSNPRTESDSFLTRIAVYLPFSSIVLALLLYMLKLLFSSSSWTKFIIPLLLSVALGFGYGYLMEYIGEQLDQPPMTSTIPQSTTPTTDTETWPSNTGTPTTPSLSPPDNGGSPTDTGTGVQQLDKRPFSIALLVITGVFLLIAITFIAIDFFRKREEIYHKKTTVKKERLIPEAKEGDHRLQVIRNYHQSSYDLIDHGAKSERSMTPGDFELEAVRKLALRRGPLDQLTDLYEEARYSHHQIAQSQATKAEKCSREIKEELQKEKRESEIAEKAVEETEMKETSQSTIGKEESVSTTEENDLSDNDDDNDDEQKTVEEHNNQEENN
jgi:hypothetical protein